MKICIISDLHVDHNPLDYSCFDDIIETTETIIIAGDISNRISTTCRELLKFKQLFRNVIWVAGNHDYYHLGFNETRIYHAGDPPAPHTMAEMVQYYRDWSRSHGIDFLHRQGVNIQGVNFLGATGWHDYVAGEPVSQADQIDAWYHIIRDTVIPWQGYAEPHHNQPVLAGAEDVQALQTLVDLSMGPAIVVTHHLPHRDLCWQKPYDRAWTALHGSFANTRLESITDPKIRLWIYGHTHQRGMKTINGQKYMCNARGYPGENPHWTPVVFDIDEKTGIIS